MDQVQPVIRQTGTALTEGDKVYDEARGQG